MRSRFLCFTLWFVFSAVSGYAMRPYDSLVNQAELRITAQKYIDGTKLYEAAFKVRKHPYALDLCNAIVCALKQGNNSKAMQFCHKLSATGVGESFVLLKRVFAPLQKDAGWNSLLLQARKDREVYTTRIGSLRHLLDSLVDKDQAVNHEWRESGMMSGPRERMDLTYDTLSRHLLQIFDSLGFLSEDILGANVERDTVLSFSLPFDIIIIHNYQSRKIGDTLFHQTLRIALKNEQIKPEYFAFLQDFYGRDPDHGFGTSHLYVQYKCSLYRDKNPGKDYPGLEQFRKEIGLFPLKDFERKLLFTLGNPGNDFRIYAPLSKYMSFANEASEQSFLQNYQIIVEQINNCR